MMSLENPEALIWSNSSIAPAEGRKPLSIMTDPDFEAMVNPSLSPPPLRFMRMICIYACLNVRVGEPGRLLITCGHWWHLQCPLYTYTVLPCHAHTSSSLSIPYFGASLTQITHWACGEPLVWNSMLWRWQHTVEPWGIIAGPSRHWQCKKL